MDNIIKLTGLQNYRKIFDKRLVTNIVALSLIIISFWVSEPFVETFLNTGLFSLSGAMTNWLAVYMLFDRVPYIYGSGVIPLNFESFKTSIHQLIKQQFFNRENMGKFFVDSKSSELIPDFEKIIKKTDLNPAFDSFLEVIEGSSFGPMLTMVGGLKALEPLRKPFIEKLEIAIQNISETASFKEAMLEQFQNTSTNDEILEKIDIILIRRLDELTPQMVKEIIERIIHKHLGWLVVWGGVFGGLIGLSSTLVFSNII